MFKKILLSGVAAAFLIAPLKAQQAVPGATAASTQSQTISGTVTSNQGSAGATPWPVTGTVTANQGLPPWAQNLTQLNGIALGSPTSPGVTPSGNLIGVNTVFSNSLLGGTNFIGYVGANPFVSGSGSIAITANASGTTVAVTATLAAAVGKTTYICGYTMTANATAATFGGTSVSNTVGGPLPILQPIAAAPAIAVIQDRFTPCVPANATNTAITVTSVNPGAGGNIDIYAYGFQQ